MSESEQYRGEDVILERIRETHGEMKAFYADSPIDPWNEACETIAKQLEDEGLEASAENARNRKT